MTQVSGFLVCIGLAIVQTHQAHCGLHVKEQLGQKANVLLFLHCLAPDVCHLWGGARGLRGAVVQAMFHWSGMEACSRMKSVRVERDSKGAKMMWQYQYQHHQWHMVV